MAVYQSIRYEPEHLLYANLAALPTTGLVEGQTAYTTSDRKLYCWNGSAWFILSEGSNAPTITITRAGAVDNSTSESRSLYDGKTDVMDFTYTVADDGPGATLSAVTLANSGIADTNAAVFTHTTSNNHLRVAMGGSYGGEFNFTLSVNDGVTTTTKTVYLKQAGQEITFPGELSWSADWNGVQGLNGSDSGFAVSGHTNGGNAQAWRSDPLRVGNYYFELDYEGTSLANSENSGGAVGAYSMWGLYGGTSMGSFGYNTTGTVNCYGASAQMYAPGAGSNLGTAAGSVFHYAYNSTSRKCWVGISADGTGTVTWSAGGAPASNVGTAGNGHDLSGSAGGDIVFNFGSGSSGGSGTSKGFFRTGGNILGTVPTGFQKH